MKTTVKAAASTKATSTDETEAEVTVTISKAIVAELSAMADSEAKAYVAVQARDKHIVKLGGVIGEDKTLQPILATHGRSPIQKALKPLFVEAYKKAGRDELYAGQQLSRVLSIAFPGGLNAKAKEIEKAKANLAKGIANNEETLTLIGLSTGRLAYQKDGTIAKRVTTAGSGGHNAKTPLESFAFTVGNAVTAANEAKLDALQLLNVLIDALKASEMIDAEEAEAIGTACTEAL